MVTHDSKSDLPLVYLCMYFIFLRRARENGGMMTKLATEKKLQRQELFDRLKSGKIFYKPQGDYVPVGFERSSKLLNR